ncbi:MAG: SDR family oxidoreductase [Chryseolinea sp.]
MENTKQFALVTGGTSGIGYQLSKLLAEDGYNLVLVARDESDLQRVASELATQYCIEAITISRDLFDPENAFSVYDEVKSKAIDIQILINDAGQGLYGEFITTDIRKELDIIQLNISSLVVLTKLFLKDMVERGSGKILNLSSIASKVPGPWQSVYHGTKAFVQSFTEAIRSEVKDSGVTITALLPGATATDFFNKADMNDAKIVKEGKLSDALDVARDGYKALMEGDDMIVSGIKNKLQVAISGVIPDARLADKMKKQQAPVSDEKN